MLTNPLSCSVTDKVRPVNTLTENAECVTKCGIGETEGEGIHEWGAHGGHGLGNALAAADASIDNKNCIASETCLTPEDYGGCPVDVNLAPR